MFDLSQGMLSALDFASIVLFVISLALLVAMIGARRAEPGTATNYAVLNKSFWVVMAAAFVLSALSSVAVWTGVVWFLVAALCLIAAFIQNPTAE